MLHVNAQAAKAQLSRLLARVAVGEEVVISKAGKPVAKLVPYAEAAQKPVKKRVPGQDAGKIWIAPDFDDPLPDDMLAAFEDDVYPKDEP
jgi:prevent-host-death family protein